MLQYEYNDRGQITQETNPEGGVTRNAYDAYGRLIHTRNLLQDILLKIIVIWGEREISKCLRFY
ncbi:hypothetical protein MAH3_17330 [Sessilibacter sp. MAH3]